MKNIKEIHTFRRHMRSHQTKHEKIFGGRMKEAGIIFKKQMIFGFYILDFVIADKMLCIEIDGSSHNSKTKWLDSQRDDFLAYCGIKTIRVKNEEAATYPLGELLVAPIKLEREFRKALSLANNMRGAAINHERKGGNINKRGVLNATLF